jgi:hypothetical protein
VVKFCAKNSLSRCAATISACAPPRSKTTILLTAAAVVKPGISRWIGQLKGGASHDVNHQAGNRQPVLEWQAGYGAVSFEKGDLRWVVNYIRNQQDVEIERSPKAEAAR